MISPGDFCWCSFWGRPPWVGGAQWFGAAGSARCLSLSFCYRCARGDVVWFWVRSLSSAAARARRSGLPSPSNVHRHARCARIRRSAPRDHGAKPREHMAPRFIATSLHARRRRYASAYGRLGSPLTWGLPAPSPPVLRGVCSASGGLTSSGLPPAE